MCGLLVQIGTSRVDIEKFEYALSLQRHRGPDDSGIFQSVENSIVLGHRRLSIIDLDPSAAQPMTSSDGKVTVVYNGEIYNFQEIRDELESHGYRFETSGDTEVLINAYLHYGIECLEQFIGMFSFVIYDEREQVCYAVRDRLGVKPLFFHLDQQGVIVSSEIGSILALLDEIPCVNPDAISSYFSFRFPIFNDSFFKGVQSVEPGTYLEIRGSEVKTLKYWDLAGQFALQRDDKGEVFYVSELRRLLTSSVRYRKIADVEVGAYLSGGVDSSAIVAVMSEADSTPVRTFTIGFPEEGYQELSYAHSVAERYGTEHHEIMMSNSQYMQELEELVAGRYSPLSVPNEVPLYQMTKELSRHVTVVLSGEGADEIFAGYGRIFRSVDEFEKLRKIYFKKEISREEKAFIRKIEGKYGKSKFEDEVDHFYTIYSYTSDSLKASLLSSAVHNEDSSSRLKGRIREIFDELGEESYFNKMSYFFERVHLQGLLHRLDFTTMASSVEGRVPFVDHRLVEFAMTIPRHYKLRWDSEDVVEKELLLSEEISETYDIPKYILKRAMISELGDEICNRQKMGFPVPLDSWAGASLRDQCLDRLEALSKVGACYFDTEAVKNFANKSTYSHAEAVQFWMILNVLIFLCHIHHGRYS